MSDEQNNQNQQKLTTASGQPYTDNEDSQSAGARGPLLLQDYILHEKMAHFNRERIPERVVHAKGSGAFGTFTTTHDISRYTKAKVFRDIGQQTRVLVRFSTVGGEKGSADTERDPRGFAIKFYTEDGNWDLVGNNTPVFFIKDPKKFADFIHTQKRDPRSHCKSPTMMWDYWSLNPESLHQVVILMSDRGTPYSYRHMNGYGSHAFSFINQKDERVWCKFHLKTVQGIRNFTDAEAAAMKANDMDWAQRDLVEAIDQGAFPRWNLRVQVMTEQQAKALAFHPFDVTKVWPHADFPLLDVGVLELNAVPDNYFAAIEQSAFAPSHLVDGIGYSPDRMLQGRLLSYPDAQRYRLGVNYEQIPVNRCPYATTNYERDGAMRVDSNGGSAPNYWPNSMDSVAADPAYREPPMALGDSVADWYDRNGSGENDHYSQPGSLFDRVMSQQEQTNTVANIVASMEGIVGSKRDDIIYRQLCHFYRASADLGQRVAQGLGVDIQAFLEMAGQDHQ